MPDWTVGRLGKTRRVKYRRIKWERVIFLFLLLAGTAAAGFLRFPARLREEKGQPSVLETVSARAAEAAARKSYSLSIEEWGPGYRLCFKGQAEEGKIYGRLEDYDLEVYAEGGKYCVRRGAEEEWQAAEEYGLEDLPFFIHEPAELLSGVLTEQDLRAEEGRRREISDTACEIYFLETSPQTAEKYFFPAEEGEITGLNMYACFAEDNSLQRLVITVQLKSGAGKTEITRIYHLTPAQDRLPDDLPQPEAFDI